MPKLKYAVKKLIACWGLSMVLGLPAIAETPVPEREKMEVGNALLRHAVIPVAANNPGRFGAHYKTRVVIFNPTSRGLFHHRVALRAGGSPASKCHLDERR